MSKTVLKMVKLRVPAGKATAGPPVGPTLGQVGVNLMEFTKLFNARSAKYTEGLELPVKLTAYTDRCVPSINLFPRPVDFPAASRSSAEACSNVDCAALWIENL